MKVSFKDFGANVPEKERYERGVDYLLHEFELGFEDAVFLVKNLKNNRSSVTIYAPSAVVAFYISHGELYVQIDGDGFWHGSDFDMDTAEVILRAAFDGCEHFGERMPGTGREWDVY